MIRALILAACAALASACGPSAADAPIAEQWRNIDIVAAPVELGAERAGRLRFRGGLALSSDDAGFGGISGVEMMEGGVFIAVTDDGYWLEARLVLDEEGALIGVERARMALMRDEAGAPFENKRAGDAEALAQLTDGRFAVAFEQTHAIRIYDLNRDGPFGTAEPGPRLAQTRLLRANAGIEALAVDDDGALIAGAEGGGRPTPLWRLNPNGDAPTPPFARYQLSGGYSLTSLDRLPDGGFVALERFYAPVIGARARITRFASAALTEGATIEAELLGALVPPMPVDNFEAIAAVRRGDGGVRIYILSDDNFSARQRTLLFAFDLEEPLAD